MENPFLEEFDQENIIELLKNMGYIYLSPEECNTSWVGTLKVS